MTSSASSIHKTLRGRVASGRQVGAGFVQANSEKLHTLLGAGPYPGTLNIVLEQPILIKRAIRLDAEGKKFGIRATINGMPCILYRWLGAPMHVAEIIAAVPLRQELSLKDGQAVELSLARKCVAPPAGWRLSIWNRFYKAVPEAYYESNNGPYRSRLESFLHGRICQWTITMDSNSPRQKHKFKDLPVIGSILWRLVRGLRDAGRVLRGRGPRKYVFRRAEPASQGAQRHAQQIVNLLNYAKASESTYSGENFPAGYHSLDIGGLKLEGQRNPRERLGLVPFDFAGKSVLDIGCNQGGMLFALADKISYGVGIDYDRRLINAANRIRLHAGLGKLGFYVFDLENEDLNLIRDFVPDEKVDIVLLLAVCMWIKNWRQVIDFAVEVSRQMLFESNGSVEQQTEQVDYLRVKYRDVQLLSGQSLDDRSQKSRCLYLCR